MGTANSVRTFEIQSHRLVLFGSQAERSSDPETLHFQFGQTAESVRSPQFFVWLTFWLVFRQVKVSEIVKFDAIFIDVNFTSNVPHTQKSRSRNRILACHMTMSYDPQFPNWFPS